MEQENLHLGQIVVACLAEVVVGDLEVVEVPVESCHFLGLAGIDLAGLDHTGMPFCGNIATELIPLKEIATEVDKTFVETDNNQVSRLMIE